MKRSPLRRKTPIKPGKALAQGESTLKRSRMKRRPARKDDRITKGGLIRCKAHLDFVRDHSCVACWTRAPIQAHHHGRGGKAIKACDSTCVPLCVGCHSEFHQTGAIARLGSETDAFLTSCAAEMAAKSREQGILPEAVTQ